MMWLGLLTPSFAAGAWCGDQLAVLEDDAVVLHDGDETVRYALAEQPTALGWQPDCRRLAVSANQLVLYDFHFTEGDPKFRTILTDSQTSGTGPRGEELVWHAESVAYLEQSTRPELRILHTGTMAWVTVAETTKPVTDIALSGPRSGTFVLGEQMLWRFDPEKTVMSHYAKRVAVHPEGEAIEAPNHVLAVLGAPQPDPAWLIAMSGDGSRALIRQDPKAHGSFASVASDGSTTSFTIAPDPHRLDQGWAPDGSWLIGVQGDRVVLDRGAGEVEILPFALANELAEVLVHPDGDRAALVRSTGAIQVVEIDYASRSNTAAAPIPPPMHIETTP